MKQILALTLVLGVLGCGSQDWHGEAFKAYYAPPSRETGQELDERHEIIHWTKDPKDKRRIGYLEKYSIKLAGSREPHDIYYIRDATGQKTLGYISENGQLYRYTRDGQAERLGEYPIHDTGIRVFYGLTKADNLAFEEIQAFVPD